MLSTFCVKTYTLLMIRKSVVKLSKILSRQGLYPFLEGAFAKIHKDAKVLNVGAGGEIEILLRQYASVGAFDVQSLDIDPDRTPDIEGDLSTYNFDGNQFDVIVMSEVLEHIRTPDAAVNNALAGLKSGGQLVLTTPFLFPIHDRPHDYYRYTKYGLAWLLRDYVDVEIAPRNSWAEALNVMFVRLIKEKNPVCRFFGPLIVLLAFIFAPLAMVLGAVFKTDFMTSGYLVTARKS